MSKNLIPAVSRRYITRNQQNPAKDVVVLELASAVRFRETGRVYTRSGDRYPDRRNTRDCTRTIIDTVLTIFEVLIFFINLRCDVLYPAV